MPNNVMNIVTFGCGEDTLNDILGFIQKDNDKLNKQWGIGTIDFNKIIPMPPEYLDDDRWYEWRWENWGTKWNSYDNYYDKDKTISFLSAWSSPIKVLTELSRQYPTVYISHKAADELILDNAAECHYVNGEFVIDRDMMNASEEEAMEFYREVWGIDDYPYDDDPDK